MSVKFFYGVFHIKYVACYMQTWNPSPQYFYCYFFLIYNYSLNFIDSLTLIETDGLTASWGSIPRPKGSNFWPSFQNVCVNILCGHIGAVVMFRMFWHISGTHTPVTSQNQFIPPYMLFPWPCFRWLCACSTNPFC